MFATVITVIHLVVAVFLILVVLVQGGNQGGIGAAFGGASTSSVFGAAGATSFLGKITYGAAAVFMLTSISLTLMEGKSGDIKLKEKLKATSAKQSTETTKPVEAAAPVKPEEKK